MDEFLPTRYYNEIDQTTGKPYIKFESSFDVIRDKWEEAISDDEFTIVSDQEQTQLQKQDEEAIPLFIQDMAGALNNSLAGKNKIQWMGENHNSLDRGARMYNESMMNDIRQDREVNKELMEVNNMMFDLTGAVNLFGG